MLKDALDESTRYVVRHSPAIKLKPQQSGGFGTNTRS